MGTVVGIFEKSGHKSFLQAGLAVTMANPRDISSVITNIDDINERDDDGMTLLMTAAWRGRADICQLLLRHGADPAIKDKEGMTALDMAKIEGHEDVALVIAGWLPTVQCLQDAAIMTPPANVILMDARRKPGRGM